MTEVTQKETTELTTAEAGAEAEEPAEGPAWKRFSEDMVVFFFN